MTERMQWVLFFAVATFIVVVFIAALLVRRHGHTVETKAILDSVEGMRQQNSNEHKALQDVQRSHGGAISRMLERLGFLRSEK